MSVYKTGHQNPRPPVPLLTPAVSHPPPSLGPQSTGPVCGWGLDSGVPDPSSHSLLNLSRKPRSSSSHGLSHHKPPHPRFPLGVVLHWSSPARCPAEFPTSPHACQHSHCATPGWPGSLVSGAQLTFFLLCGQLSLCPTQVGGFSYCGRVAALVGLLGVESAWGQPGLASGGTSVQYLTGRFSFSSQPGPEVALEDGGHLNSQQWNLSGRF